MKCFKAALMMLALAWPAIAQAELTGTPFVEGLKTPTKIVMTRGGNLLVSEAGDPRATFVANHGRVSLVDRVGARRTLLDRLPSGLDLDDGGALGPTGLWVADRFTLYVAFGIGDVTKRNAARGEVPNPSGLSSALFSSLWRVRFSQEIDDVADGFALDPAAHHGELADGREVRLVNGSGERARIRVLADLRDIYPGSPPNPISASNPFGLLLPRPVRAAARHDGDVRACCAAPRRDCRPPVGRASGGGTLNGYGRSPFVGLVRGHVAMTGGSSPRPRASLRLPRPSLRNASTRAIA